MDPLTQGTLGTAFSQACSKNKNHIKIASFSGFVGGLLADADVLIRSETDPILFLEFHRQFTHSFVFIPVGGLLCALALFFFFQKKTPLKTLYFFSTAGYATHALLDACTTYGTQLLWPFTNYRFAWNLIGIIDPLFTIPILIFATLTLKTKNRKFALIGLTWCLFYLSLGYLQNYRAQELTMEKAKLRGHHPKELVAKPTIANLVLWRTIYEHDGHYYVDAVHVGLKKVFYPGQSAKLLKAKDIPELEMSTIQKEDFFRFKWFSNNYLYRDPNNGLFIGDLRYSLLPNEIEPLWGILLKPLEPKKHVDYITSRNVNKKRTQTYLDMILGRELPNE